MAYGGGFDEEYVPDDASIRRTLTEIVRERRRKQGTLQVQPGTRVKREPEPQLSLDVFDDAP